MGKTGTKLGKSSIILVALRTFPPIVQQLIQISLQRLLNNKKMRELRVLHQPRTETAVALCLLAVAMKDGNVWFEVENRNRSSADMSPQKTHTQIRKRERRCQNIPHCLCSASGTAAQKVVSLVLKPQSGFWQDLSGWTPRTEQEPSPLSLLQVPIHAEQSLTPGHPALQRHQCPFPAED